MDTVAYKHYECGLFDELPNSYSAGVAAAVATLSLEGGIEARGAVFTKAEVVDFILDLVGYTIDQRLHSKRILEPACGDGDFLLAIIRRLLMAWRGSEHKGKIVDDLGNAVCAVELHRATHARVYNSVNDYLIGEGIAQADAKELADRWLLQGDFLLEHIEGTFDYVVGNPPYVRQEMIPQVLLTEYRRRYSTLYDRADLYIPFIERSLSLLSDGGHLGFICADRWMKNRYGGPLRSMIASGFHLKAYVDMTDTPAFQSDVNAYPAITVISREQPRATRIASRPVIERNALNKLARELRADRVTTPTQDSETPIRELLAVTNNSEPWLLEPSDQMILIRRIEEQFPTIEQAGCIVGIGVATGADKAFIGQYQELDVEPDRKLPIATTGDIRSGEVQWTGKGVINPFTDDGSLVDLEDYPRLKQYLYSRYEVIANRHCARKNPLNWYRTIDRITPALACKPKLLIPDIKGTAHIVFEPGHLYPHHNLYYVVSDSWNLHALQTVLLSDITRLFIATYSTHLRGGYLRFQAQYLRRLRLPHWQDVPEQLQEELIAAAQDRNVELCTNVACKLYGITQEEWTLFKDGGM